MNAATGAVEHRRPRFHLAMPVHDLAAAREFYGDVLGCPEGRSAPTWVDFDLYGHQFVAHLDPRLADARRRAPCSATRSTATTCRCPTSACCSSPRTGPRSPSACAPAGVEFVIEPHTRFAGEVGEQSTMFLFDPSGNALEFKAFADDRQVFAH